MNIFIAAIEGSQAILTPEESWHCAKVLRFRPGENVRVIDGVGASYDTVLRTVTEKRCVADITAGPFHQPPRACRIHLAIAPTKQIDRIEWMLEKAVEIGVDEVTFLHCENSERVRLNEERMKKIAESAVKQSLQARIPIVNKLVNFDTFIAQPHSGLKLIAHCYEGTKKKLSDFPRKGEVVVAVGPEGDFSRDEVTRAERAGLVPLNLGDTRLRTETAGLYAVQGIRMFCG